MKKFWKRKKSNRSFANLKIKQTKIWNFDESKRQNFHKKQTAKVQR